MFRLDRVRSHNDRDYYIQGRATEFTVVVTTQLEGSPRIASETILSREQAIEFAKGLLEEALTIKASRPEFRSSD